MEASEAAAGAGEEAEAASALDPLYTDLDLPEADVQAHEVRKW